jgi:hypothetical protein
MINVPFGLFYFVYNLFLPVVRPKLINGSAFSYKNGDFLIWLGRLKPH